MKKIIFILLLSTIINLSLATNGVDTQDLIKTSEAQCLVDHGQKFVIQRGYRSFGSIDSNAKQSIINCKNLGMITDTYMFPCMGKVSPSEQVSAIVNEIGDLAGTYWIDVEYNPSTGCGWQNPSDNCQFLQDLVTEFKNKNILVGIYASRYQWEDIFGSQDACAKFSDLPLWYAHYDNLQTFSDFVSFGGWTKPDIKQYQGDQYLCGQSLDYNWY